MLSKEELKSKACQEIDRRGEEIIGVAKTIWENPELGFKEMKTSRLIAQEFAKLEIPCRDGLAITGVKGVVQGGSDGPTVAVLGELDAVKVPAHPEADPETGAVHACGHHAQIGQVIGVAVGLIRSGVLPFLAGRVAFMAVPTEEDMEFEYRQKLRKEGKLSYWAGKQELIKLGEFDDIDIAMMTHGMNISGEGKLALGGTGNGSMFKYIEFTGRGGKFEATAGALTGTTQGVNALSAARVAISAIDAQRESFLPDDNVVVKTLITRGGEMVCNIPVETHMEVVIQGKTLEAIKDAAEKVDRSLRAGALAIGGKVRITTLPGYLPLRRDPLLQDLYRTNAISLVGEEQVAERPSGGVTDMGDVCHIIPSGSFYTGGATSSSSHSSDYQVVDYQTAIILPAKAMAMLVIDLLADGAVRGREVLSMSKPQMTKQGYLAYMESTTREEDYEG